MKFNKKNMIEAVQRKLNQYTEHGLKSDAEALLFQAIRLHLQSAVVVPEDDEARHLVKNGLVSEWGIIMCIQQMANETFSPDENDRLEELLSVLKSRRPALNNKVATPGYRGGMSDN